MTKINNYGQGEENKIIDVISYDMMGNQHGLSFKKSKTMSRKKNYSIKVVFGIFAISI